jgi:hypothetical protein
MRLPTVPKTLVRNVRPSIAATGPRPTGGAKLAAGAGVAGGRFSAGMAGWTAHRGPDRLAGVSCALNRVLRDGEADALSVRPQRRRDPSPRQPRCEPPPSDW